MPLPQRQKLDYLNGEEVEVAPERLLPRTSFLSIEYPAILTHRTDVDTDYPDEHPALTNALSSLSPLPPPYANPVSALRHIAQLVEGKGQTTLECRLGHACLSAALASSSKGNVQEASPTSNNEVYRHAIIGEVMDAHNVVLKVTKRVWRKKQRDGLATQQNGESSSERKEYTAVALGITRKVVRFRHLADFLYDPGYVGNADSADGQEEATRQALSLYDSLSQMDIEGLRNVRLEGEKEDYEVDKDVPGKGRLRVTNVRMPPPQVFDKVEVPFIYGFRQNPTSHIEHFGPERLDGSRAVRYMNRLKFSNMSPIAFSLAAKSNANKPVPSRPREVVQESRRVNEELYRQLMELFDKQPVWTRISLSNQFPLPERKPVFNQKQCLAACCYTITDGCFRDCLLRHKYDPRKDKESRFYQRISFQMNPRLAKAAHPASVAPETEAAASVMDEDGGEGDADDGLSHTFDGVTPSRVRGSYQLIDVHDEFVRPLIYQKGPGVLREKLDLNTGWYTQKHFDKIRSVMQARYHRLLEEGRSATKEECDAIIAQIDNASVSKPVKAASLRAKRPGHTTSISGTQL